MHGGRVLAPVVVWYWFFVALIEKRVECVGMWW